MRSLSDILDNSYVTYRSFGVVSFITRDVTLAMPFHAGDVVVKLLTRFRFVRPRSLDGLMLIVVV